MPPQPLNYIRPDVKLSIKTDSFIHRPEIAVAVAQCLDKWSWVEVQTAQLYVALCRTNHENAATYFCALESSKAKTDAIRVLAMNAMGYDDYRLIVAILKLIKSLQRVRDRLAHWLWTTSDDLPEAIIIYDPKSLIRSRAHYASWTDSGTDHSDMKNRWKTLGVPKEEMFVYRLQDLERDKESFEELIKVVTGAQALCRNTYLDEQAKKRSELKSHPLLVPFLAKA